MSIKTFASFNWYLSKLSILESVFLKLLNKKNTTIFNTEIPTISRYSPYIHPSLYCPDYLDSDESEDDTVEFELDTCKPDTWEYELNSNTKTICKWLNGDNNQQTIKYVLCINNTPTIYLNNKRQADKYIKQISVMLLQKTREKYPLTCFKLEKTDTGYTLRKCIFQFIFSYFVNYTSIDVHPVCMI